MSIVSIINTSDANCRNYIYYPYDLIFSISAAAMCCRFTIPAFDGQYYESEQLLQTVAIYRQYR